MNNKKNALRATGKTLPADLNNWIFRIPFDSPTDYTPETRPGLIPITLLTTTANVQIESGVTIKGAYAAAVFKGPGGAYPAQDFKQKGYVSYSVDEDHPIHDLEEFTIALWIRSRYFGNPDNNELGLAPFIYINGGEFSPTTVHTHHGSYYLGLQDLNDNARLRIKGYIWNANPNPNIVWRGHDQDVNEQDAPFTPGEWMHIVHRYRKSDSTFTMFRDKVQINQQIRYAGPKPAGEDPQPLLGALKFAYIDKIFLGTWQDWVAPDATPESFQQNSYSGQMKDILFYNKALTDTEIQRLYDTYLNP